MSRAFEEGLRYADVCRAFSSCVQGSRLCARQVKTVYELADKAEHAPALHREGALSALYPLLLDAEPLVSQARAGGRVIAFDSLCSVCKGV